METLMLCAAIVLSCGQPALHNQTSLGNYQQFEYEDLIPFILATNKCEKTCPKKCLTKFIKRDTNSYWAICGEENETK